LSRLLIGEIIECFGILTLFDQLAIDNWGVHGITEKNFISDPDGGLITNEFSFFVGPWDFFLLSP